ncbi:MAG: hypothetical protein ACI9MR_002004 [Myxococcota bacterium]|jgi:hypothetical protein
MYWVTIIFLLVLGFLAAAPMLARGRAGLKQFVDTVEPAEGWIGVVGIVWGLYQLFFILTHLGGVFQSRPIWGIVYLAIVALTLVLGFVLARAVISQVIKGGPLKKWHDAIASRRVSLGTSAMITAGISIVLDLVS